mmetsp:Transcript_11330/g.45887  ORF Transcript_11330/g.45887 Transcript_11330/m.45887 type:complete len:235 (+) Transcript_11330:224-928(+)
MLGVVEGIKLVAKLLRTDPGATRKLLHVAAGPVFLATWPWFSMTPQGSYYAAVVPLGMTAKFGLVGAGILKDPGDVRVMSRTGQRTEILRGPLLYGLVFVGATLLAFQELAAAVALASLCVGDAVAEIVGRRYGAAKRWKLPWSPRKSVAGSLAFFVGSVGAALCGAAYFRHVGFCDTTTTTCAGSSSASFLAEVLPATVLASLVGTLVESLPFPDVDNVLVPAAVGVAFKALH